MLTVEIWSDLMCPWCYLGKSRWRSALTRFPHAKQVQTVWRSFELRPEYPRGQGKKLLDIMLQDWAMSVAEVDSVLNQIRSAGAAEGLTLRPESVCPTNTFDAHRLLHLAAQTGTADSLMDGLFKAYHTDLADLSDENVLRALAMSAGMEENSVQELLRGDRYAENVRTDERRSSEVGVTAVPSFRVGAHNAVSGALSADELLLLLHARWDETTMAQPA